MQCSEWKEFVRKESNVYGFTGRWGCAVLAGRNGIEFQPLDVVNWKDYPYKPEVSFRIAHTGREILLHYKVKEASVRAVASGDNGRVWEDACVEFFVSPEGDDRYYNFECNCVGRLLIQGGAVNERRPTASQEVLGMVKRWSSLGGEPFEERLGDAAGNWSWLFPFLLSSSIPSVLWMGKQ